MRNAIERATIGATRIEIVLSESRRIGSSSNLFFDRSALHRKDSSTRSQSRIEGRREIVASDVGDRTMKKTLPRSLFKCAFHIRVLSADDVRVVC